MIQLSNLAPDYCLRFFFFPGGWPSGVIKYGWKIHGIAGTQWRLHPRLHRRCEKRGFEVMPKKPNMLKDMLTVLETIDEHVLVW